MGGQSDSSQAAVEGFVNPSHVEAKVYLSRGGDVDSTVTRDGWFQLEGVDFGLYVLDVGREGYGSDRRLVVVDRPRVTLGELRLEPHPWPIASIEPRDSLVMRRSTDVGVMLRFSHPMDRASVEKALKIEPPLAVDTDWEEPGFPFYGDYLAIRLHPADMEPGRVYKVTLDTSARTNGGQALERRFDYSWVRRYAIPGEGATPEIGRQAPTLRPMDSIRIAFPLSMDRTSVERRLHNSESGSFSLEWNAASDTLYLRPETRWTPGRPLIVGLNAGYRSSSGKTGEDVSRELHVREYGLEASLGGRRLPFANEFDARFTMPVDIKSLIYTVDKPAQATVTQLAADRVHWTFTGIVPGVMTVLRIERLNSIHGDTLFSRLSHRLTASEGAVSFRFQDSTSAWAGLIPYRDTLRLIASHSAYQRLRRADFALSPPHPVNVRWQAGGEEYPNLIAFSPQPLPSGTAFKLFPANDAAPGDTLSFRTRAAKGEVVRPFQGETRVAAQQPIEVRWNTWIDTVGFAARIAFEPAVDSLRVTQDTSGGAMVTRIFHAAFVPDREYRVRMSGMVDLFAISLSDTVEVRFRSRP